MNASKRIVENIADQYFEGFCRGAKISKDDIIIRRDFLNLVGGNLTEAAIFSRIMHYQPYLKEQDRDELAKNHTDWQQECGVTSSAARKAIKRLEEKSLITTRVDKFEGKNAVFIKVDRVHFYEQMTGEHLLQKDRSPVTKGQVHLLQKDRSIYKDNIQGIQQGKEKESVAEVLEPQTTVAPPSKKPAPVVQEKTPWFDPYLIEGSVTERIQTFRNQLRHAPDLPTPRPKTAYKKTDAYLHLEKIVKHVGEYKRKQGIMLGQTLRWLWHEATGRAGKPATYADVLDYWAWIASNITEDGKPLSIKDPKKINGKTKSDYSWQSWKTATDKRQSRRVLNADPRNMSPLARTPEQQAHAWKKKVG